MDLLEQFTQEHIIKNLSVYEVCYQVALGSLINETNANNIDPNIEFQSALGSIYELINEIKSIENASEIYDNELRKQAAMDAVQNFVNANLELVKAGTFDVEPIINKINDGLFFNPTMLEICNNEIISNTSKWESIITDELACAIHESILGMENENK